MTPFVRRPLVRAALLLIPIIFSGCSTTPLPVNYAPSSALAASGQINLGVFHYQPAAVGRVRPNQIENTAWQKVILEKDIADLFREAVIKEFRFVGLHDTPAATMLSAEIITFRVNEHFRQMDWTVCIRYTVTSQQGKIVYVTEKSVQRTTAQFANRFGALNETIKLIIEELLEDEAFLRVIGGV